jgi:hypothetical protein
MVPRLQTLTRSIGFMSLGPYVTQTCGKDVHDNEFPRMADIYSMFQLDLCPPYPVLVRPTYSGTIRAQLIFSQRGLGNS